ncbi:MAG: serine hydrolase [Pyrinomonadaceae bacterium]|nr:serine hydrolase [Pyrinomonadaceae bacterium]
MKNLVSTFLQSRIDAQDFPSAVYLVAEKGKIFIHDALGFAVVEPEKMAANIDTIYDLASLTKPLVTGLLCAKLIENSEINLSDKLSRYFVEFDTNEKREITIENLLTHTSGFQAWKPFYLISNFKSQITNLIAAELLENSTNPKVVYSDLNFITLGFLLEKIYEKPLDEIAGKEIFAPLNLQNTFYNPPKKWQKAIAANEKGNEFEKQTCTEQGFDVSKYKWRDYQIWGAVHDGNCYFMNGVSGHAGLFSTAFETFKISQQFLANQTTLLKPETCKLFPTNFTPNFNEARSIAFQLAETKDSTASDALSKDSFGHLGFTGTSLWIEPETERIFILLTNRTHARELPFANINAVRRRFHELAGSEFTLERVSADEARRRKLKFEI